MREGAGRGAPRLELEWNRTWELYREGDYRKIARKPRPCNVGFYATYSFLLNFVVSLNFILSSLHFKAQYHLPGLFSKLCLTTASGIISFFYAHCPSHQ